METFSDIWIPFSYATKRELVLNGVGLLACIGAGAMQPIMNIPFGSITDDLVGFTQGGNANQSRTNDQVVIFCYLAIGCFVATYTYVSLWVYTGETITNRLRATSELAFYQDGQASILISELQSHLDSIQSAISEKLPLSVFYISCAATGFIVALIKSWKLGLAVLSMLPCLLLLGYILTRYGFRYMGMVATHLAPSSSLTQEALSGLTTIRSLGAEDRILRDIDSNQKSAMRIAVHKNAIWGGCMGVMTFLIYSGYALAFFYGGQLFRNDEIQAGVLITVFFSVMMGSFALAELPTNLSAFLKGTRSARKLQNLIDRRPRLANASNGRRLTTLAQGITFRGVSFSYPSRPDLTVLDGINLDLPAGKTIAIVGQSGAGKSTVAALLLGLYDLTAGIITYDNIPLTELDLAHLRGHLVSSVLQEPKLFSTSIRNNVAMGLSEADRLLPSEVITARVVRACHTAQAQAFIEGLPLGYDTQVGEGGLRLSGGQRARIAIARALIRESPILILDEATANLDTISERVLAAALEHGRKEWRTTVIIAHRLSTIQRADLILVVADGRLVAQGSHQQLMSDSSLYQRMFAVQDTYDTDTLTHDKEFPDGVSKEPVTNTSDETDGQTAIKDPRLWACLVSCVKNGRSVMVYAGAGLAASIVAGLLYPAFAIVYALAYSTFGRQPDDARQQNLNALYLLICAIGGAVAASLQWWFLGMASDRLGCDLRLAMLRNILRTPLAFFDDRRNDSGQLGTIINSSPGRLTSFIGTAFGTFVSSISTLVGGAIIGLVYSWKLGLVNIAVLPLTLGTAVLRLRIADAREASSKCGHEPSARLAGEAISMLQTVISLGAESYIYDEYIRLLGQSRRKTLVMAFGSTVLFALNQTNMFLVLALGFWYGSRLVYSGEISSRAFFAVFTAVVSGSFQAVNVLSQAPELSQAHGAVLDIGRLLLASTARNTGEAPFQMDDLLIEQVGFTYPHSPSPTLRDLSLRANRGQFTALCGPSGSGKSTLIRLIQRFYAPQAGKIRLGPTSIDAFDQTYRDNLSLVSQEPVLFNMSILDNILLGLPANEKMEEKDGTDYEERASRAVEQSNLSTLIKDLPEGTQTMLGTKGIALSGGQRQRLVLARALIRNPALLLLDEATSSLDQENERVLQQSLSDMVASSSSLTIIAVAHRLSTIRDADNIFVVNRGTVVEEGTYSELMALEGLFSMLAMANNGPNRRHATVERDEDH